MAEPRENKMGVMPVKKLIITMSLPMMISMLVQALYNVVDSMFVARLSEDALTAVTLAFPMQNALISFAAGTGVGINALLSKSLGEKKFDRADAAANNGLFLGGMTYILFLLIGLFGAAPFIGTQIRDPLVREYGATYLRICLCLSFGAIFQITFERLLQSTGRTFYSMISQATGAVINIIFDPIMIFGMFGFPKLGVAGAAYATVLGQVIAALISCSLNLKKNEDIRISIPQILRPDPDVIKRIYFVGAPSILMMSIGSIMTYSMNQILGAFSKTATAVFGVYFKLQSFFFMPVFGLNGSIVPIIGYNFGAGKRKRLLKCVKLGIIYSEALLFLGVLAFEFVPNLLLMIFAPTEEMLKLGTIAFRIIGIHFPIAAVCIILGTVFQALNHGMYSMWVSVARQLLALLPAAFLLSLTGNVNMVWFAFPIAELVSLVMTLIFFAQVYKKTIVNIPNNE